MLSLILIWNICLCYEIQCIKEEDGRCIRCPRGYVVNQRLNNCIWNRASEPPIICPDGYFLDKGLCTQCHSSCDTCIGSAGPESCTACARGYYPTFLDTPGPCVSCTMNYGIISGIPGCTHCARDGDSIYCFEKRQLKNSFVTIRRVLIISFVVLVLALLSSFMLIATGGPKVKHRQRRLPLRYTSRHKMV